MQRKSVTHRTWLIFLSLFRGLQRLKKSVMSLSVVVAALFLSNIATVIVNDEVIRGN